MPPRRRKALNWEVTMTDVRRWLVAVGLASLGAACGDDAMQDAPAGSLQTPPQNAREMQAWLQAGAYKGWQCEGAVHASRSPSPHGFNRICANDAISANASGTSSWPAGAAAVKELYASAESSTPIGYAVYLKTREDSAGGANWYWYEAVPLDSDVPHDADGVVADGLGTTGAPKTICVGCHAAAGADAEHTPSPGARDQVYTPVP
jgi:hypothetical protein